MRILLVFTGIRFGYKRWIPLGPCYISAMLKQNGFKDVIGINLAYLNNWNEFGKMVKKLEPDIVGFTANTIEIPRAWEACKIVKSIFPESFTIIGGPSTTVLAENVLSSPYVDSICIGEGEYVMLELVERLESGRSLDGIKGLWFKRNGKIVRNRLRMPIDNLDLLPFPDRELFGVKEYLRYDHSYFPLAYPCLHMIASRGCIGKCSFCQPLIHKLFGKFIRYRSPENVIEEMSFLRDKYHVKSIIFSDDTLTANKKWLLKFCEKLRREKLGIDWWAHSRVDTIDRERIRAMKRAGCKVICFGVEAVNRVRNDVLKKGVSDEQIKRAFKLCKVEKMITQAGIMVGNPTETAEEISQTYMLVKKLKPEIVWTTITSPHPGSYLHDFCRDNNLLLVGETEYEKYTRDNPFQIKLNDVSPLEVVKWQRKMSRVYFSIYVASWHYLKLCVRRWKSLFYDHNLSMKNKFKILLREVFFTTILNTFHNFT